MIPLTGEYALRVVTLLATQGDDACTAKDIAEATGVPAGYLSQVMGALGRAGMVSSRRGLHGGYRLTAHPETLRAQEVLRAVQAIPPIGRCEGGEGDAAPPVVTSVRRLICAAEEAAGEVLSEATVDSLAAQEVEGAEGGQGGQAGAA